MSVPGRLANLPRAAAHTIRQDELDARVLAGLTTEMLREEVLAVFLAEYAAETRRIEATTVTARPGREVELASVTQTIAAIKSAILKGVDPETFVAELKQFQAREKVLLAELAKADAGIGSSALLHADLGAVYREKVAHLTDAFEDEALKAQAFERIRALIDEVTLTPADGELAIELRGELASMLELCACGDMQKAPDAVALEALQIKVVAGTRFHLNLRPESALVNTVAASITATPVGFGGLFRAVA